MEITLLEHLEIARKEQHGLVSGTREAMTVAKVIEHNRDLYEHIQELNLFQLELQLSNQAGRLWAWWCSGVITDVEHNDMLQEVRNKVIKRIKSIG